MSKNLSIKKFSEIDLSDPFFDTLIEDYIGFKEWFERKASESAYVLSDDGIQGFLYMKIEEGPVSDILPSIEDKRILKLGTFKVNPHGTRLGERFLKKAFDFGIKNNAESCYVTIFEKHIALIELLKIYGFALHGTKATSSGTELVYYKTFSFLKNDILIDYPLIKTKNCKKYLLAIYPKYHTIMFPDSILNNEKLDILDDVSHTNSIHKIYVTQLNLDVLNPGDIIIMYRTSDGNGPAEFRSVATSICVVEDVKSQNDFDTFEDFFKYANTYSVFDRNDLHYYYGKGNFFTLKMTYNAAMTKRLNRKTLADEIGLDRKERWSFIPLTNSQFIRIVERGAIHEGLIID